MRTSGSASSARRPAAPAISIGATWIGASGARPEMTSHTAVATTTAPVSTSTVVRHDPVSGMNTELESTRVAMPPIAGMVL